MFRNESEFNRWWSKELESVGCFVVVLAGGNQFQASGLPDRLVIHRRFMGFVEGKKDSNHLSPLQRAMCRKVVERRRPAFVLRCVGSTMTLEDVDRNPLFTVGCVKGCGSALLLALERACLDDKCQ